jgi:inorganic pyrophosphatase
MGFDLADGPQRQPSPSSPAEAAARKVKSEPCAVPRRSLVGLGHMPSQTARHTILSAIGPYDAKTEDLRIVIETPKGSRNKYSYDSECDCLQLSTVLPEGMVFPYDFGFIPSTLGDDGDPLDILILMEAPVVPGCVVTVRLVGAIEAEQKENDGWTRNDRLVAVATHAQTYQKAKSLGDLRPHLVDEIIEFFVSYNKLRGRKFRPGKTVGPGKAEELIKTGIKKFRRKK